MNKLYAILAAVALQSGLTLQAETVENYVQDFESTCSINDKSFNLPGSWGHIAEGYVGDKNTYYPTYTYKTSGGVNGSRCIQVADQTSVGSYNDSYGQSYDLIVTPEVSGTITIDYKKTNSYSSGCLIEFYTLVPDGDGYARGELIDVEMPELTNSNFTTVSFNLDTPQRVGIRASYGYIDHFTASKAEVEKKRALKINSASNISVGTSSPVCDENNRFILKARVKIENSGEADILPGDPDATVTLCWASNYSGANAVDLSTTPITEPIPVGQTLEMEVEAEVDANVYPDRSTYVVRENVTGSYELVGYVTPNLYKPQFQLWRADDSRVQDSDISSGKFSFDFGRVRETTTKTYKIRNAGAGPLTLTSVDAPEGITVTPSDFTIAYNEEHLIQIVLSADNYVTINGNIVFNIEGIDPVSIPVVATVLDPEKYYVDFENRTFPTDMIVIGPKTSSRWSVEYSPSSNKDKPANDCWLKHNTNNESNHDRVITPLLEFAQGDQFSMDVYMMETSSKVSVYYSDDRNDWTLADELTSDEMVPPTGGYNSTVVATPYSVSIPAGKHYIAIECNKVYIDDIYGGKKVQVGSDLYPVNDKVPDLGMVNYDYVASVNITNLMDEAVTATVTLIVDGEEVATDEVDVDALAANKNVTLSFLAYKPLEAVDAYFKVEAEGCQYTSAVWPLTIQPEMMIGTSTVISETTTHKSNVPFMTNWYRTYTETVYPASTLDLKEGDVITSIIYKGYCTSTGKTLKMSVWVENCDVDAPVVASPTDVASLTQVANETAIALETKGSASESVDLVEIDFATPFTYTGGSLRIVTRTILDAWSTGTSFVVSEDDALKTNTIYVYDDANNYDADFPRSWAAYNSPVVSFGIEVEPVKITGKVLSNDGTIVAPLADATITLTALPETRAAIEARTVTYTATTDSDGNFSIDVMQPAKNYALKAAADYHSEYNHDEIIVPSEGAKEVNFTMTRMVPSGIDSVVAEPEAEAAEGVYNMLGVRVSDDLKDLAPGIYIVNGKKVVIK